MIKIDQYDEELWQNKVQDENDGVNNQVADFHQIFFLFIGKHSLGSMESLWCSQFVLAAVLKKKELLDLIVCRGEKSNE